MKKEEKQEPGFDEALRDLEQIVEQLEGGELALERSLELFEQGIRLATKLDKRLADAELRVEKLTEAADGRLQAEPIEDDEP